MLVLSRLKNEQIIIVVPPSTEPQTIDITVTRVGGSKVGLGFEAAPEVRIYRKEVGHGREKKSLEI